MSFRVKIIGAGSIGNHLAFGCRNVGLDVTMVDIDPQALDRTKHVIYPERYSTWDENIKLKSPESARAESFDAVLIGTPPATHLPLTLDELDSDNPPRVIMIEKPICTINEDEILGFRKLKEDLLSTQILVAYNQRFKDNTMKFLEVAESANLGKLVGLTSEMLESWNGILKAHFWMENEFESYLAYTSQGGGALQEHSHALNLFQFVAAKLGQGKVKLVEAEINWKNHDFGSYDFDSKLFLTLDSGLTGEVRQDLITWPAKKELIAKFEKGNIIWRMGNESDSVELNNFGNGTNQEWNFPKIRPDDFKGEIKHLVDLLNFDTTDSSISLESGLETIQVISAAFKSDKLKSKITL